jgi:thermitase
MPRVTFSEKGSIHLLGLLVIISILITGYIFYRNMPPNSTVDAANLDPQKAKNVELNKESAKKAEDRILLKFNSSVSETKQNELLQKHQLTKKQKIQKLDVHVLNVPKGKTIDEVIEKLKKEEAQNIKFAEPDTLVTPSFVSNDAYLSIQWGLHKIQAPDAWDYIGSNSVILGVCDTGFDLNHIDLTNVFLKDLAYNTVDDTTNVYPIFAHGTSTAGVAAASVNDTFGTAGVAMNAKVIPVKISNLSNGGAWWSDAAECISYAVDRGAKVVNLSYRMADSAIINEAALYAESKQSLVVVSAGNDGGDMGYPELNFIAVSATTESDQKAWFSSYGNYVDVAAPGERLIAPIDFNSYGWVQGTSFAAPITTGTLGLIYAVRPTITAAEAKNILFQSVDDIGSPGEDIYFGAGRVNAKKAMVQMGATPVPPTPTPTPTPAPDITPPTISILNPTTGSQVSGIVPVTAEASDNIAVAKVEFRVHNASAGFYDRVVATDTQSPYTFNWDTSSLPVGQTFELAAIAYDTSDRTARTVPSILVTIKDSTAPKVSITQPLNNSNVSGKVDIWVEASDNVGVTMVDFLVDGVVVDRDSTSGFSFIWDSSKSLGNRVLSVNAYDALGNMSSSAPINVTVMDSTPPTVSVTSPLNNATIKKNSRQTVQATASDNVGVTRVEFFANNLFLCSDTTAPYSCPWQAPNARGGVNYTIKANAFDQGGHMATSTVTVTVK